MKDKTVENKETAVTEHQDQIVVANDNMRKSSVSSSSSESSASSVEEESKVEESVPAPAVMMRETQQIRPTSRWSYNKDELVDGLNLNLSVAEMRARVDTASQQSWKRNDQRDEKKVKVKGPSFKEKVMMFKNWRTQQRVN